MVVGYDKNRREMYRVLVIFGGRNTDGKADACFFMEIAHDFTESGQKNGRPFLLKLENSPKLKMVAS